MFMRFLNECVSVKTHHKTQQIIGQRMNCQTLYSVLYDWVCTLSGHARVSTVYAGMSKYSLHSLNGYIMFDSIRSYFGNPYPKNESQLLRMRYVHSNGNSRCSCSTCINMYKWNLYTLWDKITKRANRNRDLFADLHFQIHHCCVQMEPHHCQSASTTWHVCMCVLCVWVQKPIWLHIKYEFCTFDSIAVIHIASLKKLLASTSRSTFDRGHHLTECNVNVTQYANESESTYLISPEITHSWQVNRIHFGNQTIWKF